MPVTFTFGEWLSARSVIGSTLAELGGEYDNLWTITPEIGATQIASLMLVSRNRSASVLRQVWLMKETSPLFQECFPS